MSPDERARAGIFMAFQRPVAIPGVKMADFLRHAATNVRNPDRKEGEELIPMREFRKELRSRMEQLRMDEQFARRYVNDGFSGGEMKRAEILQLAMLQPKFAILDETDSGLGCGRRTAGQSEHCRNRRGRHGAVDHHAPRQAAGAQSAGRHARDAWTGGSWKRVVWSWRPNCTATVTIASAPLIRMPTRPIRRCSKVNWNPRG